MATFNITIKRLAADGTTWDILNPKTTIENVTGLQSALNGKLDVGSNLSEGYLVWGGRHLGGQVTPLGMSMSSEHNANRLALINGNALQFEYSSNGGSTWTNYNYTNEQKSLFCTLSLGVPIGRTGGEYTTSSRTRITLTAQNGTDGYVYTNPKKMLIEVSSSGGMQVLVETRTGDNFLSNGAWSTFGTYSLSGWSGWNDIPLLLGTLGGGTNQTANNWQLRLTFIMTSKNTEYPTTAQVNKLRIYGENAWLTPSTLAATNNLYTFDMYQNATFPSNLAAASMSVGGQAVVLNNDYRLTNSRPASDVHQWAKEENRPSYNLDQISEGTTYKRVTQSEKNTWNNKWKQIYSGVSAALAKFGTTSITVPSDIYRGKTAAIEIRYGSNSTTAFTNKIVFVTLGTDSGSGSSKTEPKYITFSEWDGLYLKHISTKCYVSTASTTTSIVFGNLKTLIGSFSGSSIEWTTQTLDSLNVYIGKIWVLE